MFLKNDSLLARTGLYTCVYLTVSIADYIGHFYLLYDFVILYVQRMRMISYSYFTMT